jgi:hypothetical protein
MKFQFTKEFAKRLTNQRMLGMLLEILLRMIASLAVTVEGSSYTAPAWERSPEWYQAKDDLAELGKVKDFLENLQAEVGGHNSYYSLMSEKWRKAQVSQVLSPKRMKILELLLQEYNVTLSDSPGIFDLIAVVELAFKLLGKPESYAPDRKRNQRKGYAEKRTSLRAFWSKATIAKLNLGPDEVKVLGILAGRLKNMLSSAMAQTCAPLDKHGLFDLSVGEEYDLSTVVWCLALRAELDARKAFTLDSQMQGGLAPPFRTFLNEVLFKSDTTDWKLVAMLLPEKAVIAKLSPREQLEMLSTWLSKLKGMRFFLNQQWEKGASKCAANGWVVLRRGSGVDSSGWNSVAGAWGNALRHIKVLCDALGLPAPAIFSCPKLTAGDQAMWAEEEGKDEDNKVTALADLVESGVLPWTGLDDASRADEVKRKIAEVCEKHGVPLHRFIGIPKERAATLSAHQDMICGVKVGEVPPKFFQALKDFGFAGYKPCGS